MTTSLTMPLAEILSREIERVTQLRERRRLSANDPGDAIMVAIMTAAIEAGHTAAGTGDQSAIANAIRELQGFTS